MWLIYCRDSWVLLFSFERGSLLILCMYILKCHSFMVGSDWILWSNSPTIIFCWGLVHPQGVYACVPWGSPIIWMAFICIFQSFTICDIFLCDFHLYETLSYHTQFPISSVLLAWNSAFLFKLEKHYCLSCSHLSVHRLQSVIRFI